MGFNCYQIRSIANDRSHNNYQTCHVIRCWLCNWTYWWAHVIAMGLVRIKPRQLWPLLLGWVLTQGRSSRTKDENQIILISELVMFEPIIRWTSPSMIFKIVQLQCQNKHRPGLIWARLVTNYIDNIRFLGNKDINFRIFTNQTFKWFNYQGGIACDSSNKFQDSHTFETNLSLQTMKLK